MVPAKTRAQTRNATRTRSTSKQKDAEEEPNSLPTKRRMRRAKNSSENCEDQLPTAAPAESSLKTTSKRLQARRSLRRLNVSNVCSDSPKPKRNNKNEIKTNASERIVTRLSVSNVGSDSPKSKRNKKEATVATAQRRQARLNVPSTDNDSPKPKRNHKKEEGNSRKSKKKTNKENINVMTVQTKKSSTEKVAHDNNNYLGLQPELDSEQDFARRCQLLKELCVTLDKHAEQPQQPSAIVYTHADLQQFLTSSTLRNTFPLAYHSDEEEEDTAQLLQQLNDAIDKLAGVQLDQLIDLYHLAILMQSYQPLNTHCQGQRCELLQTVGQLSVELPAEYIEYIGISLCDRFVFGTGRERMQRVIDMHRALVLLINDRDVNRGIAMTILLATFAKISGMDMPKPQTDIISQAFDVVKRVDWMQLIVARREADMFVLVRCFALIINTHHNRLAHANWNRGLGSEIHKYFMQVLRTVRFSSNYNAFAMMVERFIAFCVVRGAAASFSGTDVFDTGSL
ncbi:uncharacterized protein [Drosophila virilis]|uniref:uncharacterized protein isoform X2 n=1 Tax=Drosophila virilis TaxID=7244 RepID=UPI0013963193|nr:uncharacterized protein LOC6633505 isoform X2 [Drosophila virilis]